LNLLSAWGPGLACFALRRFHFRELTRSREGVVVAVGFLLGWVIQGTARIAQSFRPISMAGQRQSRGLHSSVFYRLDPVSTFPNRLIMLGRNEDRVNADGLFIVVFDGDLGSCHRGGAT
jgi:hypothetical protein